MRTLCAVAAFLLATALDAQQFVPKPSASASSAKPVANAAGTPSAKSAANEGRSTPAPVRRKPGNYVDRISSADIDSTLAIVAQSDGLGASFKESLDGQAYYVLNRRTKPSDIELHCQYDDLLFVRSGEGILRHGSRMIEPYRFLGYEWRGRRIENAREDTMRVGDILRIPAGEAHQIRNLSDSPLVYVIVKIRNLRYEACTSFPKNGM